MLWHKTIGAGGQGGGGGQPWDISTAVYQQSFSLSDISNTPRDLFFTADGLKMYTVSLGLDGIVEYTLSTAWDISTSSFVQKQSLEAAVLPPGVNFAGGFFFKPDGLKFYVLDYDVDDILEYNLSVAWDVSTLTFSQSISISAQGTIPLGLFFKPDGLKLYIYNYIDLAIDEYTLSTAWDISTTSFSQSISVSQDVLTFGLFFRSDGLKAYITGTTNDSVYEYDLGTAWDISSLSFLQSFNVSAQDGSPYGIFFKPDGLKMYVVGAANKNTYEYNLG